MNDSSERFTPPSLDFPYALGGPAALADFRCEPEDFIVDEDLGFSPEGFGEHLLVQFQKRGENTGWLAQQLAQAFSVREMDVGFCGLKDRNALTSQWFSLYLPKSENDGEKLAQFQAQQSNISLLAQSRHPRKLRRGQHRGNHFHITLKNVQQKEELTARLTAVAETGVPNYFGEQRFGRGGSNLYWAGLWFEGGENIRNRSKRVMAQSAARSYLFNKVLAERVRLGDWNAIKFDDEISVSGPLWGRGRPLAGESLNAFEAEQLAGYESWMLGLEHVGSLQERRPLVLKPENFQWTQAGDVLELDFQLPPGAYATSVLREIAELQNKSGPGENPG
ncbi:tRNA pseudouridine13 synthase [Alteromonadaceae bacterium Bs31]|nr:tRNA pseudouridine13 synthase [Alteromonadaceae bacterium Bs31]